MANEEEYLWISILKFAEKAYFENKPLLTVDSPIPSSTIYSSVGKNHVEVVFLHLKKFITLLSLLNKAMAFEF